MANIHGTALRSALNALEDDPYAADWDARHEQVAEWHNDEKGHRVCGCGIHQAFCPICFDYTLIDEMRRD